MKEHISIPIGAGELEVEGYHSKRGTISFEVSETWFAPMIAIQTSFCGSISKQEFILHKSHFQRLADLFQKAADTDWFTDHSVGQGDFDSLGHTTGIGNLDEYYDDSHREKIEKEQTENGTLVKDNVVQYKLKHPAIKGTLSGAIVHNDKVIQVFHSKREYEGCEAITLIDFTYESIKVTGGTHTHFDDWPRNSSDLVQLNWNNLPENSYLIVGYEYRVKKEEE